LWTEIEIRVSAEKKQSEVSRDINCKLKDALEARRLCGVLEERGVEYVKSLDPLTAWVQIKPARSIKTLDLVLGPSQEPLRTLESAKSKLVCLLFRFVNFPGVTVKMVVPMDDNSPCRIVKKTTQAMEYYDLDCGGSVGVQAVTEADSPASDPVS